VARPLVRAQKAKQVPIKTGILENFLKACDELEGLKKNK